MNTPSESKSEKSPASGGKSTLIKIFVFLVVAAAAGVAYWQYGDALTLDNLASKETALREAKANAPFLVFGMGGILSPQLIIAFIILGIFPIAVKKIMARVRSRRETAGSLAGN